MSLRLRARASATNADGRGRGPNFRAVPRRRAGSLARRRALESSSTVQDSESRLREALSQGSTRRDDNLGAGLRTVVDECVSVLESQGGVTDPTSSDLINGRWRLLFTTRPGTSSPIQRAFTGVEAFAIYQDIDLKGSVPKVDNVVIFGDEVGELKVEAEAVTDAKPKEGFVPRRGQGLPFLGKSDNTPPTAPNKRIDFQFSRAAFDLKSLPFKIPYPVPFKLLQDESKGWLDTTYLSPDGTFRLSRGNKGTLFVLTKEEGDNISAETLSVVTDRGLLKLIDTGGDADQVEAAIEKMAEDSAQSSEETLKYLEGEWKLKWTSQGATASGIQKFATSFDNFQVIGKSAGSEALDDLQNVANFADGFVLRAFAGCAQDEADPAKFNVEIRGATLQLGPADVPLNFIKGNGWLRVVYVDEEIRVSRGSKGSLFVHTRSNEL